MGGFLAALAAAGDAGVQSMNQNIVQQNTLDLNRDQSDLALEKAKAIATFTNDLQVNTANTQRQQMTERIGTAKNAIISGAIAQKYGQSDAAVADANAGNTDAPLTADQKAAITQSKGADAAALDNDPDTYTQAAMKTGDLDPKTIASVNQRDQAAQMRLQAAQDRMATLQAMNFQTNETRSEIAQLRAFVSGNGKLDTATGRMMITSLDADMKVSATQRKALQDQLLITSEKDKPALQQKISDLDDEIKGIRNQKQSFFLEMGTAAAGKDGKSKDDAPKVDLSDPNAPIGVRQNNPGNIRNADGTGFKSFPTPQAGFDAIQSQLLRYARGQTTGKPLDTVNDIIGTWAPPSDDNDTTGYIKQVAADLGVNPDKSLNLTKNPDLLLALSSAIARKEIGPKFAEAFINPGNSKISTSRPNVVLASAAPKKPFNPQDFTKN